MNQRNITKQAYLSSNTKNVHSNDDEHFQKDQQKGSYRLDQQEKLIAYNAQMVMKIAPSWWRELKMNR
jgi:hypothetical protein